MEIETENNVLLLNELSGKAKQFLREVVAVIEVLLQKKKTVNGVVVDITFFFLSFEKKKNRRTDFTHSVSKVETLLFFLFYTRVKEGVVLPTKSNNLLLLRT